jgi:hypothetical protein
VLFFWGNNCVWFELFVVVLRVVRATLSRTNNLLLEQQNIYIFGISEKFATRKSTILISRATSNLTLMWQFSIFKPWRLPTDLKKSTQKLSYCNFLRVKRDQFQPNCKKIYSIINRVDWKWHFSRIKSSLGSQKLNFGPSKPNPKYFCIWLRLNFVARPSKISQSLWKCANCFEKIFLKIVIAFNCLRFLL